MPFGLDAAPLAVLAGLFALAAICVWLAGTRLARAVNSVAEITGLGKAFTGMLLLGGITSLPEVAAVSTSAALGNAPLAINNLLGTASLNLILLAVADAIYGRGALTGVAGTPASLMQGALSMLLGVFVAMLATAGDVPIFGVGAGSAALLLASAGALWIASRIEHRHVWQAVGGPKPQKPTGNGHAQHRVERPLRQLVVAIAGAAAVILVGGFTLSVSADAIAQRTGISAGLVGFLLVGLSTSIPEISSVTQAIRMRQYDMAVGDIFGTNLFNFSLIFLADLIYRGDPILAHSGRFEAVGAMLAVLLTGIFLVGLIDRRSVSILRMGLDSLAAVVAFAVGLAVLAQLAA